MPIGPHSTVLASVAPAATQDLKISIMKFF
jgi:hypothetical protein